MSGTPPPNYNPNDSLLSGGDSAKIIPVQGGGSLTDVPNSYNPDASLLSGGETAKIIPVQGGGKPGDSNAMSTTAEANNENNEGASKLTFENNNEGASELTGENNNMGASELTGENNNEEGEQTEEETTNANTTGATEENQVSKEVPCPEPDSKNLEDLSDTFESSENAKESKLTETIRLNAKDFVLRKAKAKRPGSEEKDDVMEDWKTLVFTQSEADFLNTLGLSPKLLFTSFYCLDKDWQDELSQFLYYLTVLTCYPARFVITKGECQQVREFLEIVESNMKAQQLRKLAETPIPVTGPIALSNLEEEEEEKEVETNEGDSGDSSHRSIFDRLKSLTVEDSKEKKSFSKKIKTFLSKLKFPSLFKKMKEDQENGNFPQEVNENEHVDDEGNVVNNDEGEKGKTREEIEEEYLQRLRELEIRKATESLPKEFQTETYRQYINRELRKHGFKEGNFANE